MLLLSKLVLNLKLLLNNYNIMLSKTSNLSIASFFY